MACSHCGLDELLLNGTCAHGACGTCWQACVDSQLPRCRAGPWRPLQCIEEKCRCSLPRSFACEVSPTFSAETQPAKRRDFKSVMDARRLKCSLGPLLIWGPRPSDEGPMCAGCGEQRVALVENPGCLHAACEACWTRVLEAQARSSRDRCCRELELSCMDTSCTCKLSDAIWRHAVGMSSELEKMEMAMRSEMAQLEALAGSSLVLSPSPFDSGPVCLECKMPRMGLISNAECNHVACELCWRKHAERQLEDCRARCKWRPSCFSPGCKCAMPEKVWRHACRVSQACGSYLNEVNAKQFEWRLFKVLLVCNPDIADSGPLCVVCREPHLALLENPACGHSACDACWTHWAEEHVERCVCERRAALPCIGPCCRQEGSPAIWNFACARSESLRGVKVKLEQRRRLQGNVLFPAAAQINCLLPGCLGLGYLGFETVMCFMCEHQWQPESAASATADVNMQIALGDRIKVCPGCGEHIEKNGGCDHMTCRCRYEFWWSTMEPYKR
eukprot:TRINITY_DN24564_c0_g1_i2.p1 TRINITY_DN24564_c0_g1~~TRINITY_DN24564_c0_g1_i2.p1  ORF type:complete len:512 (+),score=63.14 TRINITY_DN24564_c0_g1_i2:28-1536(+)